MPTFAAVVVALSPSDFVLAFTVVVFFVVVLAPIFAVVFVVVFVAVFAVAFVVVFLVVDFLGSTLGGETPSGSSFPRDPPDPTTVTFPAVDVVLDDCAVDFGVVVDIFIVGSDLSVVVCFSFDSDVDVSFDFPSFNVNRGFFGFFSSVVDVVGGWVIDFCVVCAPAGGTLPCDGRFSLSDNFGLEGAGAGAPGPGAEEVAAEAPGGSAFPVEGPPIFSFSFVPPSLSSFLFFFVGKRPTLDFLPPPLSPAPPPEAD